MKFLLLTLLLLLPRQAAAGRLEDLRAQAIRDYGRGHLTSAAQSFARAARLAPQDALTWLDAAVAYRDLDKHDVSQKFFAKAATLERRDPDVHAALGWAALRAGRDDTVHRLMRLPLPEPYAPTTMDIARDRLRSRVAKPAAKAPRKPAADGRRKTQAAGRPARRTGHHVGGESRAGQPGRRARTREGQRHG